MFRGRRRWWALAAGVLAASLLTILALVWWARSGPLLAVLPFPESTQVSETPDEIHIHTETPQPLDFALGPDDRAHVLTRSYHPKTGEVVFQVWSAATTDRSLRKLGEVRLPAREVNSVRLGSDGRRLWVLKAGEPHPSRTEIWRLDTGEIEGQTQPLGIRAVLPQGRMLAFPGKGGNSLGVWEPGENEPRLDFPLPFESVDQLAYHMSEEGVLQVLTRNRQDIFEVHRLDRHGGRQTVRLSAPADSRLLNQADFSADGRYVAMAFGGHLQQLSLPNLGPPSNRFARVWDTRDGRLTHEFPASDAVAQALLAPDNSKLLVVQAQGLVLWDLAGQSCLWDFKGCNNPKSAAFRRDGKHVAVVGLGGPLGGPALFWLRDH